MEFRRLLVLIATAIFGLAVAEYPLTTLQCYSSLTKPDFVLICPEARWNKYCVKETSTLTQTICGQSIYFGDTYVESECEFKKCSAECEEGSFTFTYDGNEYTRKRYCCTTDLCNSANSINVARDPRWWVLALLTLCISVYLCLV